MRRILAVWMAVGSVVACSEPVLSKARFDLARLAATEGSTFVLARIENQTREPFALFDHICAGGARVVTMLRDTITLWPDGSARRAMASEQLVDGVAQPGESHRFVATGKWAVWDAQKVYYYSDGPSIQLFLTPDNYHAGGYMMPLRLAGPDSLNNWAALGGWCAGPETWPTVGGDARHAEFLYVRL
jgi:hypothetical protein